MKSNLGMAIRFCNTVRYIDDLLALNNKKFEEEIVNIYPPELTLKRTTESDTTLSYLDVSISICRGNFITEVFDKRDNLCIIATWKHTHCSLATPLQSLTVPRATHTYPHIHVWYPPLSAFTRNPQCTFSLSV